MTRPGFVAVASAVLVGVSVLLIGIGGIAGVVYLVIGGAVVAAAGAGYQVFMSLRRVNVERPLDRAVIDVSPQGQVLRLADESSLVGRFVGREWLLQQIDDHVVEGSNGYLVIRAEAGMGKSAFAFFLASSRSLPIHMTRASGEGRNPSVARRNLGAQLIRAWGLRDFAPGGELSGSAGSVLWFEQVINAAATKARSSRDLKLMFVVDGLDEAFPTAPSEATGIPLGLPAALPVGCIAVVTTRPGVSLRTTDISARSSLTIDVDGDDNVRDLRRFLERSLSEPPFPGLVVASELGDEEVLNYLCDCAAGVWIYAATVLEDIARGNSAVDDVRTLPSSLAEYYDVSVARWQTLDDWSSVGLPALATCVAAGKPLTLEELRAWAGAVPREGLIRWVNGPLRAFLAVRSTARSDSYEIRHESFREFVARRPADGVDDADALARAEQLAAAYRQANDRAMSVLLPPLES